MPDFLPAFAIIAIVLTVTALAAGLVERSPLSFPIMFLGLGFLIGERGLGFVSRGPHSQILEIVGTLTLSLVLFLDAVKIQVEELGKRWIIPALILGPCTVIIIALGSLPLVFLLGFGCVVRRCVETYLLDATLLLGLGGHAAANLFCQINARITA